MTCQEGCRYERGLHVGLHSWRGTPSNSKSRGPAGGGKEPEWVCRFEGNRPDPDVRRWGKPRRGCIRCPRTSQRSSDLHDHIATSSEFIRDKCVPAPLVFSRVARSPTLETPQPYRHHGRQTRTSLPPLDVTTRFSSSTSAHLPSWAPPDISCTRQAWEMAPQLPAADPLSPLFLRREFI